MQKTKESKKGRYIIGIEKGFNLLIGEAIIYSDKDIGFPPKIIDFNECNS